MQPRSLGWQEKIRESQKHQLGEKLVRLGNDAKIGLVVIGFNTLLCLIWVLATRSLDIFFWVLLALIAAALSLYVVSVWRLFLTDRKLMKLERVSGRPSLDD